MNRQAADTSTCCGQPRPTLEQKHYKNLPRYGFDGGVASDA